MAAALQGSGLTVSLLAPPPFSSLSSPLTRDDGKQGQSLERRLTPGGSPGRRPACEPRDGAEAGTCHPAFLASDFSFIILQYCADTLEMNPQDLLQPNKPPVGSNREPLRSNECNFFSALRVTQPSLFFFTFFFSVVFPKALSKDNSRILSPHCV